MERELWKDVGKIICATRERERERNYERERFLDEILWYIPGHTNNHTTVVRLQKHCVEQLWAANAI